MNIQIKRALISVSNKTNLSVLAELCKTYDIEVISSGGTGRALEELGVKVVPIQEVTGNPEAFGGRMKTLSFQVSSSLLFRRGNEGDETQAQELGIKPIDLVVCNLYPFRDVVQKGGMVEELVENIDIGGPTMVRAGAKNFNAVSTIIDPSDYEHLAREMESNGGATTLAFRKSMALKAFAHTAQYDSLISKVLELEISGSSRRVFVDFDAERELRYGENPHQKAWIYSDPTDSGLAGANPLQGKALSYNNMLDADAAYRSCVDMNLALPNRHAVSVIKHLNPCGAAVAASQITALEHAWSGDPISAFGSIICFNKIVEEDTARFFKGKFVEVIIAPDFTDGALSFFAKKKNLRLLKLGPKDLSRQNIVRSIDGGFLIQQEDSGLDSEFTLVTQTKMSASDDLLRFGTMVSKHIKSNAIVLVKQTEDAFHLIGAGMGNPNRLVSTEQAIAKAHENGCTDLSDAILISDAFFPFRDNVDLAHKSGITAIVQPGGSIRDPEVIEACNEFGIAMACTGRRHFRH